MQVLASRSRKSLKDLNLSAININLRGFGGGGAKPLNSGVGQGNWD